MEVDGAIHDETEERDSVRDEWARANGFRVLRFCNEDIISDLEAVLEYIASALKGEPASGYAP